MVKALDLSSNGRMSAWVRTPLLVVFFYRNLPYIGSPKNTRGHPGLNQGPLDLQSNALPLSYIPAEVVKEVKVDM